MYNYFAIFELYIFFSISCYYFLMLAIILSSEITRLFLTILKNVSKKS